MLTSTALLTHLEAKKIPTYYQHGFRHCRSCKPQLIQIVDELLWKLVKGEQVHAVVMDFSKAFDMVLNYSLLLQLSNHIVQNKTLVWIQLFLSGRTQLVVKITAREL